MAAVWRMVGAMLLGTTLCTGQHRTIVRVELEMELAEPPPPLCLEAGREYDSLQFWQCRARDSLQLLRWAHARGYWFARVQVQEDAGAVRYQLHAGEAVRLDSLEIRSREPLPEEAAAALHRAARSVRGMVLSWDAVSALLDTLLAVLEEVGYPGAYAELLQARRSAQGAVLEVALDAGAPARLDTLIVEGNQHTRPEFLQRWGGAVPGMVLSRQNVAAVAARLQRLGWLELAAPPRVQQLPDGRWAMWLQVREQPSAVLDGAVGYDQRSGWNGMLRAALQNLLGTGRAVELSWYRAAQRLQELSAAYEEPVRRGWDCAWDIGFASRIPATRRRSGSLVRAPTSRAQRANSLWDGARSFRLRERRAMPQARQWSCSPEPPWSGSSRKGRQNAAMPLEQRCAKHGSGSVPIPPNCVSCTRSSWMPSSIAPWGTCSCCGSMPMCARCSVLLNRRSSTASVGRGRCARTWRRSSGRRRRSGVGQSSAGPSGWGSTSVSLLKAAILGVRRCAGCSGTASPGNFQRLREPCR
jgi:hypothetical protein